MNNDNIKLVWGFEYDTNKFVFRLNETFNNAIIVLRELTTNLKCYHWTAESFQKDVEYFIIPTSNVKLMDTDFSGFVFSLYQGGHLEFSTYIRIRNSRSTPLRFYSDEITDTTITDHFYIQYLDFCNNKFLASIINDGDVIVDVGASCGTFAYNCMKKNVDKIICLEPSPSFYILRKTFNHRVECIDKALSSTNNTKTFYFTNQTTLSTFDIDRQRKYDTGGFVQNFTERKVACITLSSLVDKYKLSKINLLKLDVEGSEYEIFDGLEETDLGSVNQILMEFHHNESQRIKNITDKLSLYNFDVQFMDLGYNPADSISALQGVIYAKRKP